MRADLREIVYFWCFRLVTVFSLCLLLLVLVLLLYSGYEVLSFDFLTSMWSHRNIEAGGIFPAIVGSLYLGMGVLFISFPLGLATAIYLTEYSSENWWKHIIELAIRNLAGVPSVVFGLFGFAVFVNFLNFGSSILSAILTLSVMTLPWVITASVEALEAVPRRFRESSFALGGTKWDTVKKVVLPAAIPGSITGGILGLARALGETAPIIIVGATFYLATLPSSPLDQFMALPYHTFILATQHADPHAQEYSAATALVLIVLTFVLSFGAIVVRYYFRKRKDW